MTCPTMCDPCTQGARCDTCGDLMCTERGPAPQPGCGLTCTDCPPCPCAVCLEARCDIAADHENDMFVEFARDRRAGL